MGDLKKEDLSSNESYMYRYVSPMGFGGGGIGPLGPSDIENFNKAYNARIFNSEGKLIFSKGSESLGVFIEYVLKSPLNPDGKASDAQVMFLSVLTPKIVELEKEIGDLDLIKRYFIENEIVTYKKVIEAFETDNFNRHKENILNLKSKNN